MTGMYGCQSCSDGTRFLCTGCSLCSSCCGCGDGGQFNGDNGAGYCQGQGGLYSQSCGQGQIPPMPSMPPIPSLPPSPQVSQCSPSSPPSPYSCPCAVLCSYGLDAGCGTTKVPDISHPCPWPWYKRVFVPGCPIVPGYQGHIPGFRFHGAGRTFGDATRDTCCIMGQWGNCCPLLPCRIFEQ